MPSAERSVVIAAPITEVFAFFADAEQDPRWRSQVKEIKREGDIGNGARYHQTINGPRGRSISADFEVTAFEPDTHLAFQVISGPVRPHGDFRLRTVPTGTEVTFRMNAELTGMQKVFMARPVQKAMLSEVAGLDRAKDILESGTDEAPVSEP
jgi:uncharacterized protein YndB with AHSA1/START domain